MLIANEGPDSGQGLHTYDDLYIVDTGVSTCYNTPAPFPDVGGEEGCQAQASIPNAAIEESVEVASNQEHPRAP